MFISLLYNKRKKQLAQQLAFEEQLCTYISGELLALIWSSRFFIQTKQLASCTCNTSRSCSQWQIHGIFIVC